MTLEADDGPERAGRGRPRNPAIEIKIMEAALRLYGQAGWQGFNLDGVARGANVSKDALYRRWKSRESLLDATLRQTVISRQRAGWAWNWRKRSGFGAASGQTARGSKLTSRPSARYTQQRSREHEREAIVRTG